MWPFKRGERPPALHHVRFDDRDYDETGEPDPGRMRTWLTPRGDGLGLYLFTIPPDLPHVASVAELRARYKKSSTGVIDVTIVPAGDTRAVQVISKAAQQPSGLTFVGSLILPFRDFSYVLKIQCAEHGMTGIREAIVLDRALGAGVTLDPYTPELDAEFPDHPLSRARAVLAHLRASLSIDPEIRARPPFALPDA